MTFTRPFNKDHAPAPSFPPPSHATRSPAAATRIGIAGLCLFAGLVAGCGTRGGTVPGSTTPGASDPWSTGGSQGTVPATPATPGASDALVAERRYLNEWFAGTPVVIEIDRDGALRVEVPLQFAFDARQTKPKPALQKVLDRVGTSLRRVPTARVHLLAPPDPSAPTDGVLVDKRLKAVREEVVSRGVNAIRIGSTSPSSNGNVHIRMVMPAP